MSAVRMQTTEVARALFDRVPTWQALDGVGQSRLLRTSYYWLFAVPIIAQLMSAAGDFLSFRLFDATVTIKLALPFSWRYFYYSSFCFALASATFSIWCPGAIKRYETFSDFEARGRTSEWLILQACRLYQRRVWLWPYAFDTAELSYFIKSFTNFDGDISLVPRDGRKVPVKLINAGFTDGKDKAAFWYIRDWQSRSRPVHRLICCILYLAGFGLFAVVLIDKLRFVVQY